MQNEDQVQRVRKLCLALPGAVEKVSHGEPTFFVNKRVFAMFSNNHHNDGHVAVWVPGRAGVQESLVASFPDTYYRPPYVGVKGWVGIELSRIGNEELATHLNDAWRLIGKSIRENKRTK